MKAFLLYEDKDFDLEAELPAHHGTLTSDLELDTLIDAMARGDKFVFDVAKRVLLTSLTDPAAITYRQEILADSLANPWVVRQLYDLAVEAITSERKVYWGLASRSPDLILSRSVQVLELLTDSLAQLRRLTDTQTGNFQSQGFTRLFSMLAEELHDDYLAGVREHLGELRLRRGALLSAELGTGNKGVRHVLHRLPQQRWWERLTTRGGPSYSFQLPDRDEAGVRALGELRQRGINQVAGALAQAADHVVSFFQMLRAELAFYVGCLNLHQRLVVRGAPTCLPDPLPPGSPVLAARGLYDVCLTLHLEGRAVGNDVDADGRTLVMITGANQGGKSTFLRSLGLAQVMLQAGMFVAAESLTANVCSGVFTHYKREEDATMTSGKLDEELRRMSQIADQITPHSMLLCNESFASTNEREGSEIARQIIRALTEADVKVGFVTHLFDLADGFYRQQLDSALFLRAERKPDGQRTFRLVEGEPLPTSHGQDSYQRIFGTTTTEGAAAAARS